MRSTCRKGGVRSQGFEKIVALASAIASICEGLKLAGHHTGAACVDLCDQASCGPHVRAWCAHSRYAKPGGRFHPCRPGVEPRRCDVGRDAKHWGSFNEALSTVATRRAISACSRIPGKNLFRARLALSRGE